MKKNLRLLVRSAILLCLSSLVFPEPDQNLVADQMMSASAAAPQRRSGPEAEVGPDAAGRPGRQRSAAAQRPAFDRILTENRSLLDRMDRKTQLRYWRNRRSHTAGTRSIPRR
jgi:hypothetical protein